MKKVLKSRIFIIVILCIISCGIGVYAGTTYPYQARDVAYIPSDGETMNVNDALNELYSKNDSGSIYYLGTGTTFEISTIINNYNELNIDNFIIANGTGTYDSETGILIVEANTVSGSGKKSANGASLTVTETYNGSQIKRTGSWTGGTISYSYTHTLTPSVWLNINNNLINVE